MNTAAALIITAFHATHLAYGAKTERLPLATLASNVLGVVFGPVAVAAAMIAGEGSTAAGVTFGLLAGITTSGVMRALPGQGAQRQG